MILVIRQCDDDSKTVNGQPLLSFSDIAQMPHEHIIFIVPGKQIRLLPVKVPSLSQQDLQHAVPNILEESLSEDIQLLHFSIGPENADHERTIGIMKKTLWKDLLHELAAHEVRPNLIIPDYLTIPYHADSWTLYYDDQTAIVRTSIHNGFRADLELVATLLTLRFSESLIKPTQLIIVKDPSSTIDLIIDLPITLQESVSSFETIIQPETLLNAPAFNMLQNILPKKQSGKTRSHWQYCGFMFAGLIGFLFLSQAILYLDLRIKSSLINRDITTLSAQLPPEFQSLTTSQWGITQLLKKYERDPNPFVLLLSKSAPIVSRFKTIQLTAIDYTNKKMTLTLSSPNRDDFDAFNEALSHAGVSLSQIRTQSDHNATIETLTIGER